MTHTVKMPLAGGGWGRVSGDDDQSDPVSTLHLSGALREEREIPSQTPHTSIPTTTATVTISDFSERSPKVKNTRTKKTARHVASQAPTSQTGAGHYYCRIAGIDFSPAFQKYLGDNVAPHRSCHAQKGEQPRLLEMPPIQPPRLRPRHFRLPVALCIADVSARYRGGGDTKKN